VTAPGAVRELPAPAGSAPEDPAGLRQFLTFHLDGHLYGVPLVLVAEITPFKALNHIPHMPPCVEGLLDHRGQVIPVISLRERMNLGGQDASQPGNIIVLNLGGASAVAVLVDRVDAVLAVEPVRLIPASALLAGPEGAWVEAFILQEGKVIALLDPRLVTAVHGGRTGLGAAVSQDQDLLLDQGLQELIALAPPAPAENTTGALPQMKEVIAHTEREVGKVIDRVESMLGCCDQSFQALVRLKQESALGRLKGEEGRLAELEQLASELQDRLFTVLQQLQFQDIARQKLERVLDHIRGMRRVLKPEAPARG
jgi:purine-binding chemotaxis protein CheW